MNDDRMTDTARDAERRGKRGFSLLELLVVLAILALIAGLVLPRVIGQLGSSRTKTAAIEVQNIESALDLFMLDVGRYPTEEEGLKVLVSNDGDLANWNGPYLKDKSMPEDPWGQPYRYRLDGGGQDPRVYSLGADNEEGGDGENRDVGLEDAAASP